LTYKKSADYEKIERFKKTGEQHAKQDVRPEFSADADADADDAGKPAEQQHNKTEPANAETGTADATADDAAEAADAHSAKHQAAGADAAAGHAEPIRPNAGADAGDAEADANRKRPDIPGNQADDDDSHHGAEAAGAQSRHAVHAEQEPAFHAGADAGNRRENPRTHNGRAKGLTKNAPEKIPSGLTGRASVSSSKIYL